MEIRRAAMELERRPDAVTLQLDKLLDRLVRGEVRVPAFQRGLKWTIDDGLSLLDSIFRGFPIGTLLLWKRQADAGSVTLGTFNTEVPAVPEALFVVDGQQRTAWLAMALLVGRGPEGHTIVFDLEERRFKKTRQREESGRPQAPSEVLLDSAALLSWLLAHPELSPDQQRAAIQAGKNLREYGVPAYVVSSDDERILRVIFERMNNTQKKMTPSEVFDGLHGSPESSISAVLSELDALDFGPLDPEHIRRPLWAIAGLDPSRLDLSGLSDPTSALERTRIAMRAVALFLREDAQIPNARLLPYKFVLTPLSVFFDRWPAPKARSRELLSRWVWRSALSEQHWGSASQTRQVLSTLDTTDEELAVQGLLALAPKEERRPDVTSAFNFNFARTKLLVLALLSLDPLDPIDGSPLRERLLAGGGPEPDQMGRLFRSSEDPPRASIANVVLLAEPSPPKAIRELFIDARAEVLRSHAIDEAARAALVGGDAVALWAARAALLDRITADFFASRARWRETDRPSLSWVLSR